jgi:hypothetical protein
VARASKYWEENGWALFHGLTQVEWKKQPGWACNQPHYPDYWQTPNRYFRSYEFDLNKPEDSSWHEGPSDVEGFLKEMQHRSSRLERNISRRDPKPFGNLDLQIVLKELQ